MADQVPEPSEDEMRQAEDELSTSNSIRLMAYGATGTGKSTLLNTIVGEKLFEEGDGFDPQTKKVEEGHCTKAGVDICAYDTPGFEDYSGNEQEYLKDIKKISKGIDLFIYCIDMRKQRAETESPRSAINMVTRGLGPEIWTNSIVVLTFANAYEISLLQASQNNISKMKSEFNRRIALWLEHTKKTLKDLDVPKNVIDDIMIIPAGYSKKIHLETQEYWFTNVWIKALLCIKTEAQAAMLKIAHTRFCTEENVPLETLKYSATNHPLVLTSRSLAKGAAVGGASAGAIGGVTFGAIGALIGGLLIGIPSFGVFASLGMALGGAAGATVGVHSGAAMGILIAVRRRNKKIEKIGKKVVKELEQLNPRPS